MEVYMLVIYLPTSTMKMFVKYFLFSTMHPAIASVAWTPWYVDSVRGRGIKEGIQNTESYMKSVIDSKSNGCQYRPTRLYINYEVILMMQVNVED